MGNLLAGLGLRVRFYRRGRGEEPQRTQRLKRAMATGDGVTIFARKTKRPGLSLSPRTFVDQPSPKCCSIANVFLRPDPVNGPSVLELARAV